MPKIITLVIIAVLAVLLIVVSLQWASLKSQYNQLQQSVRAQQTNQKIVQFASFFVDKVLLSNQEVSFDDRLQMENMVRDLNDQQVLDQWTKFAKSKTTQEVQTELVGLLKLLLSKISS